MPTIQVSAPLRGEATTSDILAAVRDVASGARDTVERMDLERDPVYFDWSTLRVQVLGADAPSLSGGPLVRLTMEATRARR